MMIRIGLSTSVSLFERDWGIPFYKTGKMPPDDAWANLLDAASFILLDWKLWPDGAPNELRRHGVRKESTVRRASQSVFGASVFIFTNESPDAIKYQLRHVYDDESAGKWVSYSSSVKRELVSNGTLDLNRVHSWVMGNASVYALTKWDQLFRTARRELFSAMYAGSPHWPRVFWRSYQEDGVDPGLALTEMINESLRGRMQFNAFDDDTPISLSCWVQGGFWQPIA